MEKKNDEGETNEELKVERHMHSNSMKKFRLRLGAALHFLMAIGHVACLFFLEAALRAYGILELMQMLCFSQEWALYVITILLSIGFVVAGIYALAANGDLNRLPLQGWGIRTVVCLYTARTIVGISWLIRDFSYLQFFSTLVPACLIWCYMPGMEKKNKK